MPTLIPHVLTGALIQKAGGKRYWAWIPLAFFSHFWLDSMNPIIFHAVKTKSLWVYGYYGFEVVVLAYFIVRLRKYWLGALVAVAADVEHLITGRAFDSSRWGESAHNWVWYNPWTRTEWGLLVYVVMIVLIIAILRNHEA